MSPSPYDLYVASRSWAILQAEAFSHLSSLPKFDLLLFPFQFFNFKCYVLSYHNQMGAQECRRHAKILLGNVVMQMAVIEKVIHQVFLEWFKNFI
jgi:hypothetical protein